MKSIMQIAQNVIQLISKGEIEQAKQLAQTLAQYKPQSGNDYNSIGLIHYHLLQLRMAIPFFQKAIQLEPKETAYLNNLALALLKMGEFDLATNTLQKALAVKPNDSATHFNLGVTFQNRHDFSKALEHFDLAAKANPKHFLAITAKANILEKLQRHDEAIHLCLGVLQDNPDNAQAHIQLGSLYKTQKKFPEALHELNQALKLNPNSSELYFERGHVLHALKQYPDALDSFKTANKLQNKQIFTRQHFEKEVQEIKNFYQKLSAIPQPPKPVDPSQPIYIVGSPRSGTTLLAQMLGMHPEIISAGELEITRSLVKLINTRLGSPNNLETILNYLWFECPPEEIQALQTEYKRQLSLVPHFEPTKNILDKLPSNARRMALINRLFPNAPIIHIIRDGREVAFSAFTQNFKNYVWHSYDVFDALIEWQATIDLARLGAQTLGCPYLEIRYEDLVQDPKGILQTVLEFLKKSWCEDCLKFNESKTQTYTASYNQVREKIYTSSVSKSKCYPELYDQMTDFSNEKLKALNYL